MYHETVSFLVYWVAPVMTGAFIAVLPVLLHNAPTGKH